MDTNCKEQILFDVVAVDIVLASECHFIVPPQEAGLIEMAVETGEIGEPVLTIATCSRDDEAEMENAPTLEQSEKIQLAGKIVSHSLSIPVAAGFERAREAISNIGTQDVNIVLHTDNGEDYLIYSLPCSSSVLLNKQNVNHLATVKIDAKSMNHVIRLI